MKWKRQTEPEQLNKALREDGREPSRASRRSQIAAVKSKRGKTEEERRREERGTRQHLFEEPRAAEISSAREDKRVGGWTDRKNNENK